VGEIFVRDGLFDDDARDYLFDCNARTGHVSGSPNAVCSSCGYTYYMTLSEFLIEALSAGFKDPDFFNIFHAICRSCGHPCVYRRYFCFTCNKWKLSLSFSRGGKSLGSKPRGACLVCGKISWEFLRDEHLLLLDDDYVLP